MPINKDSSNNTESKDNWGIPQWLEHFTKLNFEQNRKTFKMFEFKSEKKEYHLPGLLTKNLEPKIK